MSFLRKVNETMVVDEPIPAAEPAVKSSPKPAAKSNSEVAGPFLPAEFVEDFRKRWDGVQTSFVDEPRAAVRQADELVASTIKRLAESLGEGRSNLEGQWTRGGDINTEDLRITLKQYRSYFQKLMSV